MSSSQEAALGGVPFTYISLLTLTVQNSLLGVLLHYSRMSVSPGKQYSAAAAVLLNEVLKGLISFGMAWKSTSKATSSGEGKAFDEGDKMDHLKRSLGQLKRDVFSPDCWKLAVPSVLYVLQNNLQFVAASNLDVPTFQVTYNLKVLTTALFSVILLKRRLSLKKWSALILLALGVGIVQIQSSDATGSSHALSQGMDRMKGLAAVALACLTSGLAGVYFEMVLKGSSCDIWTRNVQLSFFSILPALLPVFAPTEATFERPPIFANFGLWAWAVVLTQVIGGLATALVIKYSDNIVKGFATSLAIILSFIAGVALFDFEVTHSFVLGTVVVVLATYLYNSPDQRVRPPLLHMIDTKSFPVTPARKYSKSDLLHYSPNHPSPLRESVPLIKEHTSPAPFQRHTYNSPSTPDTSEYMYMSGSSYKDLSLPNTPPSPRSPLLSQVLSSALESTGKTFQEKLDEEWVPMGLGVKKKSGSSSWSDDEEVARMV